MENLLCMFEMHLLTDVQIIAQLLGMSLCVKKKTSKFIILKSGLLKTTNFKK